MKNSRNTVTPNGKLINAQRRVVGWTQAVLAKKSGYTERLIGKAEAGNSIAMSTLEDICESLLQAGCHVSLADLRCDPVSRAREFIEGMYTHKCRVIDETLHFLHPDVVFDINGDPNTFPFAGHHVGLNAARRAFEAFYEILEPPADMSELEHFEFLSTGRGALVWGKTWTRPIGVPLQEPIDLAIRFDFKEGLLVHFDDRFDTLEGAKHFAVWKSEALRDK